MPAHVAVALDTAPPQLAWGEFTRFGDGFEVCYSLNEPAVIAAEFVPQAGGPTRSMFVEPARLWLPAGEPDAARGVIRALARDAVGNEAWHELRVIGDLPPVSPGSVTRHSHPQRSQQGRAAAPRTGTAFGGLHGRRRQSG